VLTTVSVDIDTYL